MRQWCEIIGKWKWLMWNGLENLLLDNGIRRSGVADCAGPLRSVAKMATLDAGGGA